MMFPDIVISDRLGRSFDLELEREHLKVYLIVEIF